MRNPLRVLHPLAAPASAARGRAALRRSLLAAACVLAAACGAHASPPPRLRLDATPPARGAGAFVAAPVEGTRGGCATRLESLLDALAASAARPAVTLLPTSHSTDTGGIAVLEDDGSFTYPDKDGHRIMDIAAVGRAFYRTHGDDYDALAVYLASGQPEWLGSPGALAACWVVRNDTQGIGLAPFDLGAMVGSPARLQELMTMNALSIYPADPEQVVASGDVFSTMDVLAHEFAHRWLAYTWIDSAGTPSRALLGRALQHWNFFFDSDTSYMEGCDWAALPPDSFVSSGGPHTFGALDQYLMGLRPRAEMDSFFTIGAPYAFDPPGSYSPTSVPFAGIGLRGTTNGWTIADLERQNGVRVPDAASAPHQWRVAIALLVPNGEAASESDLAKLADIRARFPGVIARSTGGRGSVDVSLDSRAGQVRLAHVPPPDREELSAPVTLRLRAWIDQAGLPLALVPSSVAVHWRAGTSGGYFISPLAASGADSFAVMLAPPPGGGTLQYWFSAASDSAGIAAVLPAGGPSAPFMLHIGPDTQAPVIKHVPVTLQAPDRLPQALLARVTDNLGVAAVWLETSLDGGPIDTVSVTPAGADSFVALAGAGLSPGHRVAYRFGARDAAAAGNVVYSKASFDTLRVVHAWFDDFENPVDHWSHAPVLWSGRDPWHLETDSLASSTAWHCGSADGSPYDPHVDAALTTPFAYAIVPGTAFAFDERHQLEESNGGVAWDGARLELQVDGGPWQAVEPLPGYTHAGGGGDFLPSGVPCWSGDSHGWVTRTLDLTAWAPGPLRLRFRMGTDDFVGADGLWVDRVRLRWPDGATASVPMSPLADAASAAWPNPARGALNVRLALARAARVEWALYDLQGRRAVTLWAGPLGPGAHALTGDATAIGAPGLYFSRVRVDGRVLASHRVAIVR